MRIVKERKKEMGEVKGGVSAPDSLGWALLEIPINGIIKDQ